MCTEWNGFTLLIIICLCSPVGSYIGSDYSVSALTNLCLTMADEIQIGHRFSLDLPLVWSSWDLTRTSALRSHPAVGREHRRGGQNPSELRPHGGNKLLYRSFCMEMNGGFLVTKIKQLGDRVFEKILSEKNTP